MKKNLTIWLSAIALLVAATQLSMMQLGLANYGQEFGTYGQYNRVVRLVSENPDYKITNHGLNRDLEWRELNHLNRFYVKIRTKNDQEIEIAFTEGSPEMKVTEDEALKDIIQRKVTEQTSKL